MDDITINWEGLPEILAALERAEEEIWKAADRAMNENAEDLLGRSIEDAPVDEGTLKGSGSVRDASTDDEIVKIVGFNTPYAATQHERTDLNHPKGGKAKYMEDNLKKQAKAYHRNVADRIKEAR